MISRIAPFSALFLLAACGGGAEEADDPMTGSEAEEVAAPAEPEPAEPTAEPEASATDETEEPEADSSPSPAPAATSTPEAAESPAPAPSPDQAAAPVSAPPAFAMCKACHSVEPGETGIGPSLAGVFGAEAGHMAGFDYSDAMANSGVTWDEATLQAFLADPKGVIPGNSMAYGGMRNDAQRQAVIDYLKSL